MRQIDPQLGFATLFSTLAMAAATAEPDVCARTGRARLLRARGVGCATASTRLRLWQQRARGRRQLRMFDDHLLRDIGVTRLQAEPEADKPFWRA